MHLPKINTIMTSYIFLENCWATTTEKGRNINLILGEQNLFQKFQLVHLGNLVENQLAQNQNLLVTDERTSGKICHQNITGILLEHSFVQIAPLDIWSY